MEPRIQYAQTSDGVSIAYWTLGEGMPLVHLSWMPYSHVEMEWQDPENRRWYEALAEKRMLLRYDPRGFGLSDRDVSEVSLDLFVQDLEAVADRVGVERFALLGVQHTGPVAIRYAVRHPQRVSHLILWCSYARPSDFERAPQVQATRAFIDKDWETYTETIANVVFGWSAGEPARRFAALIREAVSPDVVIMGLPRLAEFDVANLIPQITAPTLVLHRRQAPFPGVDVARRLTSAIPGARLTLLEGTTIAPWQGDTDAVLAAIDEFLGESEQAKAGADLPEAMAVILFADIVDSTALTEQLGDAAFREKAAELDASLRTAIRESNGMAVEGKLVGDGLMAVFTSARQAVEAALKCGTAGNSVGLQLHLGIHAGDVIREGNNVYGGAVNIAARIAGASAPGEVLVSDTVRSLARTSAGVAFDDRGEHELKGVADPQRLFTVRGGG